MPILASATERNLFRLYVQRIEIAYSNFEQRLVQYVEEQLSLGRTRAEIFTELKTSLNNGMGIFKQLAGDLEASLDFGLNATFQVASNEPLKQAKALLKWRLDPSAEHCDSCLHQASLPARPFGKIPFPGAQPTHGGSNCHIYCKCTLEVAGEEEGG